MGTLQNIRKKIPKVEFVKKAPKVKKPGGRAWENRTGGNAHCKDCDLWMDAKALPGHQARKHNLDTGPMKPSLQRDRPPPEQKPAWGDNGRGEKKTYKAKPYPKPSPTPTKNFNKPGANVPIKTTPIANSYNNPASFGTGDSVVDIFNQWAERLPQNYLATRREAESMGEAMRGVADALRRRAHNMVDVIGVHPTTVEPYEEAAGQISNAADAFMEVANRIEAKYRKEIEFVNAKDTPNLNYLAEDGEH